MSLPPLSEPIDAIVFDCDGTLSHIEGITELARYNNVEQEVHALTEQAMNTGELNASLYAKRLALTRPTRAQVNDLSQSYIDHATPDIRYVIGCLQQLQKKIFILSAGITQSITGFADWLAIPRSCLHAVQLTFDDAGGYLDFDHNSPLVDHIGKHTIINQLIKQYPRIIHVGDGKNDLSAKPLVTRFIGYGGAFPRPSIAAQSDHYITCPSMQPLLELVLTADEQAQLAAQTKR